MTTAYPAALDSLSNPTSTTTQDQVGFLHADQHANANDAIEAIEAKVGTGASTPVANSVFVGNGTGTTAYLAGLTSAYLAAGAVTQIATQTTSFTGTRTTASYADVDTTNGKVSLTTTGGKVLVICAGYASNASAGVIQHVALREDSGSEVGALSVYSFAGAAGYPVPFLAAWIFSSSAAAHSWYLRHINDSAVGTMTTVGMFMAAIEIKR